MFDWKNIIIILQIYQSALFAVLSFILFFRHGNYSKKYLGWFMLTSAFFAVYKGAYSPGLYHFFWYLFPLGIPLFLTFFPVFYYYIKSLIIQEYHFTRKEYIHLLPAFLLFVLSLPYYFMTYDRQEAFATHGTGLFDNQWLTFLKVAYYLFVYGYFNVQVVLYSIKIARLYKLHKSNIESVFSYRESIKLSWVIILTMMMIGFLILLDLSYIIGWNEHDKFHVFINLAVVLIILFFAIFGFLQQDIYPHTELVSEAPEELRDAHPVVIENLTTDQHPAGSFINRQTEADNTVVEPGDEVDGLRVKKYAGSGLTEQQKKVLARKLDKLMKEQIYLNGKLSIDDVAEKLDTNSKYLSQVINESHQLNFYTYINTFRIREAQRLLKDSHHQKYSIQGIARLAGFTSKSSFNEAFRRIIGMTPSEYLEKE